MTAIFKEIRKKAIDCLRPGERALLAHDLITSLEDTSTSDVSEKWDNEIKRRVEEIKHGYAHGRPAVQVLAEMRAKYS
jgi:hypothetical protein